MDRGWLEIRGRRGAGPRLLSISLSGRNSVWRLHRIRVTHDATSGPNTIYCYRSGMLHGLSGTGVYDHARFYEGAPRTMERNASESDGLSFECPQCGASLDQMLEQCPHCGNVLGDEFSATYRPPIPPAVRAIALVLLVVAFLIPLVLLLYTIVF